MEKLYANLKPSGTRHLGPTLFTCEDNFSETELREALKGSSMGKAPGIDKIPPDLWKMLLQSQEVVNELLNLCQMCWGSKQIPDVWRVAKVIMV